VLTSSLFGTGDARVELAAMLGVGDRRAAAALTAPLRLFRRGEPLALMPMAYMK